MDAHEREEFADLVAQAVIDRIEQSRNINMLVDIVLSRMAAIQQEQPKVPAPVAAEPPA